MTEQHPMFAQMPGYPQPPAPAAPQYQQAPAYPAPSGGAPMGYGPNPQAYGQPGFPQAPQGYGAPQGYPQAPQQPAPALATGTLDAFFAQPTSGGGAALKFPQIGTAYVGVVARGITNGDIQQQTQPGTNMPATYRDGRPKFVMKVPLRIPVSPDNPDGQAQWFVQGNSRSELARAMAEAGAPDGPPEAGAVIWVQHNGTRPGGPGMNASKTYAVKYWRPGDVEGAKYAAQCGITLDSTPTPDQALALAHAGVPLPVPPQPAAQAIPQPPIPPQPAAQAIPQPPIPSSGGPGSPGVQSYLPQPPAAAPVPPPQPAAQAPARMPAPPAPGAAGPLSEDQQALLARLTGQPAA